jgi:hypothetical protein
MELAHLISGLTNEWTVGALAIVGFISIWFKPATWHEQVEAWRVIRTVGSWVASLSEPPHDPLEWGDPDRYLPHPMQDTTN